MTQVLRPKKIGVDGSALVNITPTGVEQATAEMLGALLKVDTINQYHIYSTTSLPDAIKNHPNVVERVVPHKRFWTQTALASALKQDNLDVFWSPSNILPSKLPPKSLATIHDVAFVVYPQTYSWWNRILQRATVLRAKNLATRIIAITESTKNDLKRYFNIPESRMDVVPMASSSIGWRTNQLDTQSTPKWENYILVVGRVESKKNSLNIVKSFYELMVKYPDLHLVFAGSAGYGFEKTKNYVDSSSTKNNIHFLGYVEGAELSNLYHHAKILLIPSLYEGFGMTILEGFVAGIPVVTSNFGAMKEVAGDAAVLVDPNDTENMVTQIDKLLGDTDLRNKYIQAGHERLKDFSWEKSAIKIKDILNSL